MAPLRRFHVAAVAVALAWTAQLSGARAPEAAPQAGAVAGPLPAAPARSEGHRRHLLRHLPQPAPEDRRADPRRRERRRRRRARRRVGEGDPQGARRHDAAGRRAAPARRGPHGARVAPRDVARSRRARWRRIPGRPLAHRLNRAEYANAIRDLLELRIDASTLLPSDDSSGGFDNNADVLGVSPVLLESYLTAAERVSALALGDPKLAAGRRGLPGAAGRLAGPARRGHADRHGRRAGDRSDAAARRRVPVPGQAVPDQPRHDARARVPAPARDRRGRRARAPGPVRRRQGDCGVERQPDDDRRRRGRPVHARACRSRPVRGTSRSRSSRRRTRSTRGGCRTTCAAPPTPSTSRAIPHIDQIIFTGPFNPTGPGRYAEPPPHLRVPAQGRRRRGAVRDAHPEHARAARLSRRRHRRRSARAARLLPPRPRRRQDVRVGHRPGAAPPAGQPEVRLPRRARSGQRGAGRRSTR